uniref:TSA: Wollemia nobilis Ref_Wollemi_Transcript_7933_980 transcribed RNA sequence n=1 Tax=Wollemia nobilis TaxID=56998 RepID=A0A0C9S7P4_9CONI
MVGGSSTSVMRQLSLSKRIPNSRRHSHSSAKEEEAEKENEEKRLSNVWEWDWERDMEWMSQKRKKVMVVVDGSPEAKMAMLWALYYLVNKVDILTLFHVFHYRSKCKPDSKRLYTCGCDVVNSMRALCRSLRPEIQVEGVVVQAGGGGEKARTIVCQAKKLGASLLIVGQRRPSLFQRLLFRSRREELIEFCIENTECLTLSVRKQSSGLGGYVINSRWHRDFWLLA